MISDGLNWLMSVCTIAQPTMTRIGSQIDNNDSVYIYLHYTSHSEEQWSLSRWFSLNYWQWLVRHYKTETFLWHNSIRCVDEWNLIRASDNVKSSIKGIAFLRDSCTAYSVLLTFSMSKNGIAPQLLVYGNNESITHCVPLTLTIYHSRNISI